MRIRNQKGRNPICSCGNKKERPTQGYCNLCRNKWSREKRPKHSNLPDEQRKKANARAYLHVYIKRGKIQKGICFCGKDGVEAHHADYNKPLEVIWYCREHHLEYHKNIQP